MVVIFYIFTCRIIAPHCRRKISVQSKTTSSLATPLGARDISLSTKSILSFLWTIFNETYITKIPSSRRIQIYRSPEMNISLWKTCFFSITYLHFTYSICDGSSNLVRTNFYLINSITTEKIARFADYLEGDLSVPSNITPLKPCESTIKYHFMGGPSAVCMASSRPQTSHFHRVLPPTFHAAANLQSTFLHNQ